MARTLRDMSTLRDRPGPELIAAAVFPSINFCGQAEAAVHRGVEEAVQP